MGDRIHETTLLSTSEPGKGFAVRNNDWHFFTKRAVTMLKEDLAGAATDLLATANSRLHQMRKASTQIIADLRASHSKRALLDLWADLQALSKEEFEKVIEGAAKPKGAAKKKKGIAAAPMSPDRPASRIAQLMLEKCGLSPSGAVDALRAQLATQGIRASHIPALMGTDFESWLSKLFKTVPSSHVLHAAMTLAEDRAT